MREIIRQKLADALAFKPPRMTRRETRVPAIPGKAHAVIGMRRTGKTWFMHQCLQDRLDNGAPRESLVHFNFEDERLGGMEAGQLAWVLEEYYMRFPQFRDRRKVTFFFDEIQVVSGWETFVRRIMDSEKFEVDFLATEPAGRQMLIQVAADLSDKVMREREFRALADALPAYRRAQALLLTLTSSDALAAKSQAPAGVTVRPAWEWILEGIS